MPYRLRMSTEIGDWLAELCSSAPGSPESLTATEVGAAIAAAMSADDLHDLAQVTDLSAQADPVDDGDLRAEVDYMYQRLLEAIQQLRRQPPKRQRTGPPPATNSHRPGASHCRSLRRRSRPPRSASGS